jgi:ABC-type amino acid transport substrate-binding protein
MKKALQQAQVIVVPHYDFYRYLEHSTLEELGGKIIITSCAYDDRVEFLQERGVDVIIDTAPKVLEKVVGLNVLEAMMLAALGKKQDQIIDDDVLEIICDQNMAPRVVYPSGTPKRVNRFAFRDPSPFPGVSEKGKDPGDGQPVRAAPLYGCR